MTTLVRIADPVFGCIRSWPLTRKTDDARLNFSTDGRTQPIVARSSAPSLKGTIHEDRTSTDQGQARRGANHQAQGDEGEGREEGQARLISFRP